MSKWQRRLISGVAALAVLWAACGACCVAAGWVFLPTGKDGKGDYSQPRLDESKWRPADFPHQDWDKLQSADNVFGWYRYHFTIPAHLRGRDLWLDLGIIDDSDACFVNGELVGQSGDFPPKFRSGWTAERLYRIPAALLNPEGDNVIAVKVHDASGTGGMMCRPMLGAALVPQGTAWRFKACGQDGSADFSAAQLDDSAWDAVEMPDRRENWPVSLQDWQRPTKTTKGWDGRQPQDNAFGWYRLRFAAPADWKGQAVFLDLGKIYDVDATYLNGQLIGTTGAFPSKAGASDSLSAAAERRVYRLPAEALAHGKENVLAVKVFNSQGLGGAVDVPMVLLAGPRLEVDPSTVARHELTDYLDQMRRMGRLADARTVLERILDERKSDAAMCALALGELTWVAHALGDDAAALAAFQRLSKDFPTHSCRRHAVRALCEIQDQRGSLSPFATPLEADLTTQGTWRLRYGNAGHILCSMVEYGSDLFGWPGRWAASSPSIGGKEPEGRPMDYQVFCSTFYRGPRPKVPDRWNWVDTWSDISAQDTKDPRALQNPTTRRRRCAWRNDGGWGHPFDNQGEDIILLLSIPPGIHTLSFYVLDWDWAASSRPRRQGFVADSDGTPLWAADADKFPAGKYLRMLLAGPRKLRVRVYKHDSACAALSGVFLDPAPRPLPSSLLSVGAPSGTAADAVRRLDALATGAGSIGDWLGDTGRAVIQQAASLREAAAQKTATDLLWLRWALWQTETFSCSTPRAVEAARQFAEALPRAVPRPEGLAVLRKLTDALFAQKRLAEAAALSAARANLLLAKPVTDESRAELEALALAWLDTDDETAVALFTRLASDLKSSLPPPEAVKALGDLGMKHFAQGRALKVNFTPGVRLFFPQAEPTPLPSFREVAWRTLESFGDKELIAKHAEKFVTAHVKQELDVSARVGSRAGAEKEPSVETARDLLKAVPGGHPLGERVQGSLVGRLVRTGMYEEAMREARAALAQGIQDPRERALVQSSLADALFRTGRVADAEKVWTELAAQPFDRFGTPAAMMSLMELYEARGQYDEAIATCRRLMEVQRDRPDMQKWTQERLERLETRARQQTKPTAAPPAAKAEEPPRTTFPAARLLGDGHHPRLRPDGGAVAYVGSDGIVIAGTDGKPMATLPLPTEEKHATFGIEPEWSPDGKSLALACFTKKVVEKQLPDGGTRYSFRDQALFLLAVATKQATQLAAAPSGARMSFRDLTWSPDGKAIAFVGSSASPTRKKITVSRVDLEKWDRTKGGEPPRITTTEDAPLDAVWLVDVQAKTTRQLTPGADADETQPCFSADGSTVAFTRRPVAKSEPGRVNQDLWAIRLSDGKLTQLTHDGASSAACYSPDGKRIAYASHSELWLMNADGAEHRKLLGQSGTFHFHPSRFDWLNNDWLLFIANTSTIGDLIAVSTKPFQLKELTRRAGIGHTGCHLSADRAKVVFEGQQHGRICVLDLLE